MTDDELALQRLAQHEYDLGAQARIEAREEQANRAAAGRIKVATAALASGILEEYAALRIETEQAVNHAADLVDACVASRRDYVTTYDNATKCGIDSGVARLEPLALGDVARHIHNYVMGC